MLLFSGPINEQPMISHLVQLFIELCVYVVIQRPTEQPMISHLVQLFIELCVYVVIN